MCKKILVEEVNGKNMGRAYYKCKDCKKPFMYRVPVYLTSSTGNYHPGDTWTLGGRGCPLCGSARQVRFMGMVEDTSRNFFIHREKCACDGRCTNATGPSCNCSCGGKNHGTGRMISIWEKQSVSKDAKLLCA